jgi:hypothetical protein
VPNTPAPSWLRVCYNGGVPVLLDLGRPMPTDDDVALLPTQLWGYDVVRLAVIESSLYLYLRLGVQSCDSWESKVKELQRRV